MKPLDKFALRLLALKRTVCDSERLEILSILLIQSPLSTT
jgi:hypothetical protein